MAARVLSGLLLLASAQAFSPSAPQPLSPSASLGLRPSTLGLSSPRIFSFSDSRPLARRASPLSLKMVQVPPKPSTEEIPSLCDLDSADGIWYLEQILRAKVYDVAVETPLHSMPRLSERVDNSIMVKREDMQPVFSFKLRGAYNMIANLDQEQLDKGIITASAGNHAQGVAMSAKHLGCKAIIAMPTVTPSIKVNSVKRLGAEVALVGDQFDDTKAYAMQKAEEEDMVFIPPFDHPLVIAGQGTIGMEILRQCSSDIHAIFIPVGGGGLIAGIASYVKRLRPEIKIIGVEPTGADALYRSLQQGKRAVLDKVDTFADGVAVRTVGEETFKICQQLVDEVILVDTDDTCTAIKDIFEDTRSITEPSGALSVAGAKKYLAERGMQGERVICITSGANMNFDKLRVVADRAGLGEKQESMLSSTIAEKPGNFRKFIQILSEVGIQRGPGGRSITEFKYRYSQKAKESGLAQVFYSVETADQADAESLVEELNNADLPTVDLSKNALAKDHIRFLAGGGSSLHTDERFFKIEFPEQPGSLRRFLDVVGEKWNISLFHYRFTGQLIGNVFIGIRPMTEGDVESFYEDMKVLGWYVDDATENEACGLL